jgi:hypothetical protein
MESNKDIYSDEYIKYLYTLDPVTRNRVFIENFPGLNVINIPDHGVARIGPVSKLIPNPKGWVNVDAVPPRDESKSLEDYLSLIPNFKDPYPSNVVEHEGVLVIRDDLIPGNLGSKARYAEALMSQVKEKYLFYAMVPQGQALKVLAQVAKKYNKMIVAIAPLRNVPTEGHVEAMLRGAIMMFYQTGGMAGARKRCRDFITEQLNGNGLYIPAGVKHPLITAGFAKSCLAINEKYKPDVVFSVASTMVMNHGIQLGFPQAEIYAIQVAGNSASKKYPGRANIIEHPQPFNEPCPKHLLPPFNAIDAYDAKGWKYVLEYKKANPDKVVMFWNVAGATNVEDANVN